MLGLFIKKDFESEGRKERKNKKKNRKHEKMCVFVSMRDYEYICVFIYIYICSSRSESS